MGGIIMPIAAIGGLLSGVASVVQAFRPPKISFPQVQIPQEDLGAINMAIQQNKELSDKARQAVSAALENYQQGRLSPQYQAVLDEWWDKSSKQLAQRLASMGLSNSTIAQSAWDELRRAYMANASDLMSRQLREALQLTGLSQEYINNLMNKVTLQTGADRMNAQNYIMSRQLAAQEAAQRGAAYAGLTDVFDRLSSLSSSSLSSRTGSLTATPSSTEKKDKEPEIGWV